MGFCFSCGSGNSNEKKEQGAKNKEELVIHDMVEVTKDGSSESEVGSLKSENIIIGAEQPEIYLPLLPEKVVGVVANQTSKLYRHSSLENLPDKSTGLHLVDFLVSKNIDVKKVFAPEHGFRGKADAGEVVKDGVDTKTGLPIISLYGKNKKPTPEQLEGIEVMIFDIQDVGARFYTYISTLHYVMEACAEEGIPLFILDRPNPNGHYIDGPILEPKHKSFVGMHPVPVVHGMTIGEYAQMINGEGWLMDGVTCEIIVVKMKDYNHQTAYSLPVKPSPNLPNDTAINLYPSLCFFEGTIVSAGRGTDHQFQVFGAPSLPLEYFPYQFTPQPNEGAKYPKFNGEVCNGLDLRDTPKIRRMNLEWLIEAYVGFGKKPEFFNDFFTKLAGTERLQWQIENGYTYFEIRKEWIRPLNQYNKMRKPYLLYE